MKSRVKQIDDAREILLPFEIEGKQAFTTQGSQDMQGHENEKLSTNIQNQQRKGNVEKHVEAVMSNAQKFVQATMFQIAPERVRIAMAKCEGNDASEEQMGLIESWINDKQFVSVQDGLTTVVKSQGQVLGEMTAKMDGILKGPVVEELERLFKEDNLDA